MLPKTLFISALVLVTFQGAAKAAPDDGSVLPFPPTPTASIAKPRLQESEMKWRVERSVCQKMHQIFWSSLLMMWVLARPNVGGPVHAPNANADCRRRDQLQCFHTDGDLLAYACGAAYRKKPSTSWFRHDRRTRSDFDGYTGVIPKTSATIAEVLRYYGYKTSAFGKWHNTPADRNDGHGALLPLADRGDGFDHFYGFLAGETRSGSRDSLKTSMPSSRLTIRVIILPKIWLIRRIDG